MKKFLTVNSLYQYLLTEKTLTFESKAKKLTRFKVLLFSLATGDFNPAHCVPGFAEHSVFKSVVSQGIATLARAESEFIQMLQFEVPVEVITSGLDNAKYIAPLKVGDTYKYRFVVSKLERKKNLWRMECSIECIVITETENVIATWHWHPAFDEKPELPKETLKLLKPKSYWRNVVNNFLIYPLTTGRIGVAVDVIGLIVIVSAFSAPIFILCALVQHYFPVTDPAMDPLLNYIGT